jgi:hypothetical protein
LAGTLFFSVFYFFRCFVHGNSYQAQRSNNSHRTPCAFFHHIGRLFNTHYLIAKAAEVAGQATTFRILNKHKKCQYYTSIISIVTNAIMIVFPLKEPQFCGQSKPFFADCANLICGTFLLPCRISPAWRVFRQGFRWQGRLLWL